MADTPGSAGEQAPDGPLLRLIKDRRIAFLIVGGVNTVIGFGFFVLFELLVGRTAGQFGYMLSLLLAHIASVLCAFVLHRKLVFRVTGHVWRDLWRFELVNLTALGVNAALMPVAVEVLALDPILAMALVTVVTTVVSYAGHRYFSFARKESA